MKYKKYFTSIITSYTLKKNIKKKQSINKNNSNYSWSVNYKARLKKKIKIFQKWLEDK